MKCGRQYPLECLCTNWMTTISNWMHKGITAEKEAKWLADLVSRLMDWWGPPEA